MRDKLYLENHTPQSIGRKLTTLRERTVRIRKVVGSIPIRSTKLEIAAVKTAAISHLTTEIPQTDFRFDHLAGTPSQECPPYFVYSSTEFEGLLLSKQLPRQLQFFLGREAAVKFLCRGLVHIVALRRVIDTGDTVQKAGLEFFQQNIGDNLLFRLPVVTDTLCPGHHKAGLAVEVNVALDAQSPGPRSLANSME